ncbi:hypothetical protein FJT64_018531 [Amphibalanus amphitrite]|uniref:Uncharacterized protein n=1 Tax=Amphibalanus amphitrite TaxID=1232801 RepID=A0A6A4WX25_AMPAM|nr:hypothetical protein FJT64_018531 [Amphibalanus amphitrite]
MGKGEKLILQFAAAGVERISVGTGNQSMGPSPDTRDVWCLREVYHSVAQGAMSAADGMERQPVSRATSDVGRTRPIAIAIAIGIAAAV